MDGGHRSRSFFRKVVHINGTSLRYGGRGRPLPNDSPEALPGFGLPPRRTSEKGICEILDGRVTDPPLRTSSASLRSAPSPKGEGLRAATWGRPYGENRTGSVGLAKSGAAVEPQQRQFLQTQGPVARKKSQKATQILRAGNILPGPRGNPRKRGSRGWAAWRQGRQRRSCRLRPPLGGSLVPFCPCRKELAAGAAKLFL